MLIGELSEKTGLTKDTIRFYEKKGLIEMPKKLRRDNNYKEYPETVLNKLNLIIKVKELGFTLNEIDTFFGLWGEEDASCENLVFTLENKVNQVGQQLERLRQLKDRLNESLLKCRSNACEFEKTIPAAVNKF